MLPLSHLCVTNRSLPVPAAVLGIIFAMRSDQDLEDTHAPMAGFCTSPDVLEVFFILPGYTVTNDYANSLMFRSTQHV